MDRSSDLAIENININIRENNGDKAQIHDIENSSNNSQEVNECLKKIVSGQIEGFLNYKENNNEIDTDDFINNICASNYYPQVYDNKEEKTDIQNSKSNGTSQCNQIDELENKAKALFEMSRMTNKDKCLKCGAVWSSYVVFIGGKMALTCQKCDTNISACPRVLPKIYSQ